MLGSEMTSVPGSSDVFLGGVVAYSNLSKERILNVSERTLIEHGAVSRETAIEMAIGVKDVFGSDLSASITGIAGPGGETETKPVGLVFIGISTPERTIAEEFRFEGNRDDIRKGAVRSAIEMLLSEISIH